MRTSLSIKKFTGRLPGTQRNTRTPTLTVESQSMCVRDRIICMLLVFYVVGREDVAWVRLPQNGLLRRR
jgi:hypothetical protein